MFMVSNHVNLLRLSGYSTWKLVNSVHILIKQNKSNIFSQKNNEDQLINASVR